MVFKVKPEKTIKLLSNVSDFTFWSMPTLDGGKTPGYRQPVDSVKETEEERRLEEIKQQKIRDQELKAIRDSAYQEGLNSGRESGLALAKKAIDEQTQLFTNLISSLSEPTRQCGEKTQRQLVSICLKRWQTNLKNAQIPCISPPANTAK